MNKKSDNFLKAAGTSFNIGLVTTGISLVCSVIGFTCLGIAKKLDEEETK